MINVKLKHMLAGIASVLSLVAMTLLSSCEHKELCFDHDSHSLKYRLRVKAAYQQEWELYNGTGANWKDYPSWLDAYGMQYDDLRPKIPDGLRMHDFSASGPDDMINMPAHGDIVGLRPGEHQLLFYNNDTEYIIFDDMYSFASAKATTRTRSRATYKGNPFRAEGEAIEPTVSTPDMLYGNYNKSYTAKPSDEETVMPVVMHPLVFKYLVRYEFSKGLDYVMVGRGALSGMASSVYLHSGRTSSKAATLLYDCTIEPWGIQAIVTTFGVTDYPNDNYTSTRATPSHALNLEVRLKNGLVRNVYFDVTKQINNQPQGGVIVVRNIEISDDDGNHGGSGFDVKVNGWGDYEDVVIPLK